MSTIMRGNSAEAAVLKALVDAGIPALLPFGSGLAFDLAGVLPDGSVTRLQVKSGRVRKGCVEFNSCATDHGNGRRDYRGRADFIAVHAAELERVFVVPVDECPSYRGYLRLGAPRNNQRRRVRLAEDYSFGSWSKRIRDAC